MKNSRTLRSVTFAPIYYFGFTFGVFPYKYDNDTLYPNGMDSRSAAFSKCTSGLLVCYVFLLIHAYIAMFSSYESYMAILEHDSCFEELCSMNLCRNVCAHFTILWMNCFANFTSTFTTLYLRAKNTLKCINDANNLLKMNVYECRFTLSYWIVIFFFAVQSMSFVLHWRNSEFSPQFVYKYGPVHLTQCLPIVTENVISVLLLIIENCYRNVNGNIGRMCDKRYFLRSWRPNALIELRKYHWAVTDMTELVSDTFALDFFIVGVTASIRFIYFLFLTLQYTARQKVINNDGGLILPSYDSVVFFVSVVGKFVYLCARCDKVISEANKVVFNLYTLENKYRMECETNAQQEVNEFLKQVKCREVSFKAYEFFTLNLRLICKVFGLTMTYFIVLMQFQASHTT